MLDWAFPFAEWEGALSPSSYGQQLMPPRLHVDLTSHGLDEHPPPANKSILCRLLPPSNVLARLVNRKRTQLIDSGY
jgi:hypothetical protein